MADTSIDISKATDTTTKVDGGSDTTKTTQTPAGGAADTANKGATSDEGTEGTGDANEGQQQDAGDLKHPDTGEAITQEGLTDYYKEKFSSSTKGAQELLGKNETLTSELTQARASETSLKKEIEDLRKIAEGKNPEGLNLHDLQQSARKNSEELALLKENTALDSFLASTKIEGSDSFKEALRALSRANPKAELGKLWDNNFKAAAEAAAKAKVDKKTFQKKSATENGKGTKTREPAGGSQELGGLSPEEFNKLPVSKRKDILLKNGASV